MNMFEEAEAMCGMIKLLKMTQDELAKKMNVSQSYIANKLRLLNFSETVKKQIVESGISERHARTLLRLNDDISVLEVLKKIKMENLNVRQTEALVDTMVLGKAHNALERAPRLKKISIFTDTIKKCVDTLKSFGIDAEERTSYYGDKMYITLCINEV